MLKIEYKNFCNDYRPFTKMSAVSDIADKLTNELVRIDLSGGFPHGEMKVSSFRMSLNKIGEATGRKFMTRIVNGELFACLLE